MSNVPVVELRPKRDARVRGGHPWVFSNELATPVKELPPGGTVDVVDASGRFVGRGHANPASLIAVRLLTRNPREDVDHPAFLVERLRRALAYRQAVYPGRRDLRLVHGEGDGLPGLVVDRLGPVLSVQLTTLGMEARKEALQGALSEVLEPQGAVLRNEVKVRQREGLPLERGPWWGEVPEAVELEEYGVRYRVSPLGGQKTGHFFDQADNRRLAGQLCAGRTVLDVYAYSGGWALHALVAGAERATVVDSSEEAVAAAEVNGQLNGVSDRLDLICDEGKRTLQGLVAMGQRYGAVILDPPAFAKTRKAANSALRGYQSIQELGMSLVEPGGFLFVSSCSHHVQEERYLDGIGEAAQRVGRSLRMVHRGQQAADHPVVPGIPETRYLKFFALHVDMA